jgi:hypothetical protein
MICKCPSAPPTPSLFYFIVRSRKLYKHEDGEILRPVEHMVKKAEIR